MKRQASRRPELVSDGLTGEEEVEGQRYKSRLAGHGNGGENEKQRAGGEEARN